jgi:hypothetical protein
MNQRLALVTAAALAAFTISCGPHARVGLYADVPGPPSLSFESDPYLVPLPGTYAYGVPDYGVDLYYADGYYWRPWQGRWYRSQSYDRGWVGFSGVPRFYTSLPRNWRDDYRANRWRGRSWDYARVPRHEVERNWSTWKRERRWADDPRRYSGDRRWHDDGRREAGRRDWDGRDDRRGPDRGDYDRRDRGDDRRGDDRRGTNQIRPDYDGRQQSRTDYDRREPNRRDVDRRVYENREVERREVRQPIGTREVERRQVERRDVRQPIETRGDDFQRGAFERPQPGVRNVEVERRAVDRREIERRGVNQMQTRPVIQERRPVERQPSSPGVRRGQTQPGPTQRGRGQVRKDANRDGIDDSQQAPR